MTLLKRRQNPPQLNDYRHYKSYLREDFTYLCVYCAIHENEFGGPRNFGIDHFRPKSKPEFKLLETTYTNLLYACGVCNSFKLDDWPSDDPINEGKGYIDPCECDYEDHFVQKDELLEGLSQVADYMIERLHLNRHQLKKIRQMRKKEEEIYQRFTKLYQDVLLSIETSLNDETLPDHVRTLLQTVSDIFLVENQARQELWARRWEPMFNLDDYR